mgnify:FL=1
MKSKILNVMLNTSIDSTNLIKHNHAMEPYLIEAHSDTAHHILYCLENALMYIYAHKT